MRNEDLPVALDLPDGLAAEVASFVETEAGWQVVGTDGGLAPALAIASGPRPGVPSVVVVEGPADGEQVRAALLAGALDVIAWPQDRRRLLDAPLRVRATGRQAGGPAVFRVAGCAGGVGTSTVTLAVGGLLAWSGRPTLVVGGDDLLALCGLGPWTGPGAAELAALAPADAAAEVAGLARAVPGVDRLTVLGGGGGVAGTGGWPLAAVVADLRAPTHLHGADLVCARADSRLRALGPLGGDVPVLVGESGPLDRAGVRRLLGRAPVGWVPWSVRVARAGVSGRVPSGLPGSWISTLRAVLRRVHR